MIIKQTYLSFKRTLNKNRTLKFAVRIFLICIVIAVLAPVLANDKPLICKYKNTWLFPALSFKNNITLPNTEIINYNMGKDWKLLTTEFILFPPCAYSPSTIDAENAPLVSPFEPQFITYKNKNTQALPYYLRHWFGTTQNGNDVLSCLIHGTKTSLSVGVFSMLIAGYLGIFLGAGAGYFQNSQLKIGYIQLVFLLIGIFFSWFYCFVIRGHKLAESFNNGGIWLILRLLFLSYISLKTIGGFAWIGNFIDKKLHTAKKINFPMDTIVSKSIELLNSIPPLLFIIAFSVVAKPSYTVLILIIGLLSWPNIARLTRAEYLKASAMDYVTSCKAIGMRDSRIILKHILPNVMPVILVQLIFGMAGAVLIESSLSFIGIGIPANTISWGTLLNEAKDHFSSWWLVLFPGAGICILILTYNTIASQITKIK